MKKTARTIANVFAIALFITAFVGMPLGNSVQAHQGEDDNSTSVSNDDSSNKSEPTQKDDNLSDDKGGLRSKVQAMRDEAKTNIEARRKSHQSLSAEKRLKVCENRKTAINNKLSSFNKAADKHLVRLNTVYDKILAFETKKNIVLTNQEALETDANAKKQAATDAVSALKAVAVSVDCSGSDTAVTLSTVRDAAHTARTALHDYRVSLKNFVVAISQTQSTQTNDTSVDATSRPKQEAN